MDNLKSFNESFEPSNSNKPIYDKDKLYSYKFVVQHLNKGPMYMKKLIPSLEQIPGKNAKGEEVTKTKITNKIFAFIYNNEW